MFFIITLLISMFNSAKSGITNHLSQNQIENDNEAHAAAYTDSFLENSQASLKKNITTSISGKPIDGIYETIMTKNVCISNKLRFRLCDTLDRIAKYLEKRVIADEKITGGILNDNKEKNIEQIRQLLDSLSSKLQDVQSNTDQQTLGYIYQALKSNVGNMTKEILSKIDNFINDVQSSNDPVDSSQVNGIITQGNENVVNQIMTAKDQVKSAQAAIQSDTVADEVNRVMENIKYTDPSAVTENINSQVDTYLKNLENKFQTLLTDIITILEKYGKEIDAVTNQILAYQNQNQNSQVNPLKKETLSNIKSIIGQSKKELQKMVSEFIAKSNEGFIKFIIDLFSGLNNVVKDLIKNCKKQELLDIKVLIDDRVKTIILYIQRLFENK